MEGYAMKKMFLTFTLLSLVACSNGTVKQRTPASFTNFNDYMANAIDTGVSSEQVVKDLSLAFEAGQVKKEDFEAYLKENLTPAQYTKMQEAGKRGDWKLASNVLIGADGAHFKALKQRYCSSSAVSTTITILAVAGAATFFAGTLADVPNEYDRDQVTSNQYKLASLQNEVAELRKQGFPDSHYLVHDDLLAIQLTQAKIVEAQQRLAELEKSERKGKENTKAGALTLAAAFMLGAPCMF